MEPVDTLISLARKCGGGNITKKVQKFIWDYCINPPNGADNHYSPYSKSLLKKLIHEVETKGNEVLDEIYEQYACYMSSLRDCDLMKGDFKVHKFISFLFPNESSKLPSCPSSRLKVQLQCSLNMLEGDTGCSLWPSSLLLSEFILSRPDIFSNRSCFEVGSGVGLVRICLALVKAAQNVILSDGDFSTLRNMMMNLELNHLSSNTAPEGNAQNSSPINCIHLPWESAAEMGFRTSSLILCADVIYDPSCLPHLVYVLATLLHRRGCCSYDGVNINTTAHDDDDSTGDTSQNGVPNNGCSPAKSVHLSSKEGLVAFIASVIRNVDTFNYFLSLGEKANLYVLDVTEMYELFDLLPYMYSYDRSTVRFFTVSRSAK